MTSPRTVDGRMSHLLDVANCIVVERLRVIAQRIRIPDWKVHCKRWGFKLSRPSIRCRILPASGFNQPVDRVVGVTAYGIYLLILKERWLESIVMTLGDISNGVVCVAKVLQNGVVFQQ